MSDFMPVDAEAREKIRTVLDQTFLIEAGAGSGKTKSLVDRMLALLKHGHCRIETLAAVTFTRKAAAELRGRFQTELERSVNSEMDQAMGLRLKEALQNLEQCYIGTIHSFCAGLLRERPVEIALDPEFMEMEEIEDAVYRDMCWHEFLLKARLEDAPFLARLDEVGLAPEELKDSFVKLGLFPEVESMPGKDSPPPYSLYRKKLEAFLKAAHAAVPRERPEKGWDGLMRLIRRCFFRQRNLGFADHRVLMETLEMLDRKPAFRITYWPIKSVGESFQSGFEDFKIEVVQPALRDWREYRHGIFLDFLEPALNFYREQRQKQARVNYEDLLLLASRLLRENPEVRAYFQRRFTHLLVDEFQDTDPIQAEMVMYLTGTDVQEKDWKKLKPKPGSLFLVGDPKQSIYRFRRADIDTYNLVKSQIQNAGGDVLPLTANFRSLHELKDWINPVFSQVFPQEFTRYQAAFASLDTVRANESGALAGVYKIETPPVKYQRKKNMAENDAAAIADFIHWSCDGNLKLTRPEEEYGRSGKKTHPENRSKPWISAARPTDFLLLFRYKKQMHVYARALEDRGIPYEITGSAAFSGSAEIIEIINLANALNDPENPIHTVSVLRGMFFGNSDNDLLEHKRKGGRFSLFCTPQEEDSAGAWPVMNSLTKMRMWWEWSRRYPASTALEKILESTGILVYVAAGDMGSSRAGNLMKLLEILREQEIQGKTAFSDMADFMSDLMSLYEIEEMSLTPGRKEAVRLMNLHKAKGLEAPVVILANPAGVPEHEPDRHIKRTEKSGPLGYFVFEKKLGYQKVILSQPVDWESQAVEEKKYQDAEERRLMYVAATRARNLLVICTCAGKLTNRSWELLDDRLQGDAKSGLSPVPELVFPRNLEPRHKEPVLLFPGDLEKGRNQVLDNLLKAGTPSYAVDSVTSLAKSDVEYPVRRESAFGMSWGRVVHAVLEELGRGHFCLPGGPGTRELSDPVLSQSLDLLLENALAAEDRDPAEKARLRHLVNTITGSDFWRRAMQAPTSLFEVPFSLKASGLELGRDDRLPVVLSGIIDLVFLEPLNTQGEGNPQLGWVIADYKTDEIVDDLQKYVDYYAPQVLLYSRTWSRLTGHPVKETGLYFTYLDRWITVD